MSDALLGAEDLVQFSFPTMLWLHETGFPVLGVGFTGDSAKLLPGT